MPRRYRTSSINDQLSIPIELPSGVAIRAIALAENISYAHLARKAIQSTMQTVPVYNRVIAYLMSLSDEELEREKNLIIGGKMSEELAEVLRGEKE